MSKRYDKQEIAVTAGGGTTLITVPDSIAVYRITTSGAVVLGSNWTIAASGADANSELLFYYDADLDLTGANLSINGTNVPAHLGSVPMMIRSYTDDGVSWQLDCFPAFGSKFITADDIVGLTVDTTEIAAGAITVAKRATTVNQEIVVVNGSFDYSKDSTVQWYSPYDCTVEEVRAIVTEDLAATDDGTIVCKVNGVNMTPSTITVPASTVKDTEYISTITAGGTVTAGQKISFTFDKTTPGGNACLSIKLLRT